MDSYCVVVIDHTRKRTRQGLKKQWSVLIVAKENVFSNENWTDISSLSDWSSNTRLNFRALAEARPFMNAPPNNHDNKTCHSMKDEFWYVSEMLMTRELVYDEILENQTGVSVLFSLKNEGTRRRGSRKRLDDLQLRPKYSTVNIRSSKCSRSCTLETLAARFVTNSVNVRSIKNTH